MIQDVYADLLFLINFSMDYLCLYICAKIMHRPISLPKILIASAIGGIYSVVSLFIVAPAIIATTIDIGFCLIICAIAFARKEQRVSTTLLCTFLFVGISMMTGGCMTAIFNLLNRLELPLDKADSDGISTYLFAIIAAAAGIISLRSGQIISLRSTITECKLTVALGQREITVAALSDSGNLVKDPLSGRSVILIDRSEISRLVDLEALDSYVRGDLPSTSAATGIRLIPINTAAGRGILCAIKPDSVTAEIYDKKNNAKAIHLDALIAPGDINHSAEGYQAIIPAQIIKEC